jgi:pimeloyl-ACP methyl ester carboxylesterase
MPTAMPGPTSHSYFSQRLRLRYVDWGNPDAPPLLMVHGGRDHCRNWDWVAAALRDEYHIIAPDLRGHGDSQWVIGGCYSMSDYVYDIAQLVHQRKMAPLKILSHSLGGMICLRYAGLYPEAVTKLAAIEGLGSSPKQLAERSTKPQHERVQDWVEQLRRISGRQPKRYTSVEEAYGRMQAENPHLSPDMARHLTIHGVNQNEDGSYSWKFDNYVRIWPPSDDRHQNLETLWSRIECPTLLVRGLESWASDPVEDGRIGHFKDAQVANFEGAGHWVHHDKLENFVTLVRDFLAD